MENPRKVQYIVDKCAGKSVLHLGCVDHQEYAPDNDRLLHKHIHRVSRKNLGVDIDKAGIERMRNGGYNVSIGDVTALQLGQEFDVIVAGDIIEHLDDFRGFFRSCKAHLARGGQLLITTPTAFYYRNFLKTLLGRDIRPNRYHTCWFCRETLDQLAQMHGFRIAEYAYGSAYRIDNIFPKRNAFFQTTLCASMVLLDENRT